MRGVIRVLRHHRTKLTDPTQSPKTSNKMPGGNVSYQGSALKQNPKSRNTIGERAGAHGTAPVRLFVKGVFLGYKGGKKNTICHTALIKLQDVNQKEDVQFYLGKRLAYIYKVNKVGRDGSKYRVIWGKVTRSHGSNGVVRAKFRTNLPAKAISKSVRCMLYPSSI